MKRFAIVLIAAALMTGCVSLKASNEKHARHEGPVEYTYRVECRTLLNVSPYNADMTVPNQITNIAKEGYEVVSVSVCPLKLDPTDCPLLVTITYRAPKPVK